MTPIEQEAERIVRKWYETIAEADDLLQEEQEKLLTEAIATALLTARQEQREVDAKAICNACRSGESVRFQKMPCCRGGHWKHDGDICDADAIRQQGRGRG